MVGILMMSVNKDTKAHYWMMGATACYLVQSHVIGLVKLLCFSRILLHVNLNVKVKQL